MTCKGEWHTLWEQQIMGNDIQWEYHINNDDRQSEMGENGGWQTETMGNNIHKEWENKRQ